MSASHFLLGWLATAAIHASVLLALAWAIDTLLRPRSLALRETLWRLALVGGLLTASLPKLAGTEPVAGHVALPLAAGVDVAPAPLTAPSPVAPAAAMSRNAALPGAVVRASAMPEAADATTRAMAPRSPRLPPWPELLAFAWMLGIGLVVVRVAIAARRLRAAVAGMPELGDAQCRADAAALGAAAAIAAPRLRVDPGLAGPIAVAGGVICLPQWALSRLDRRQRAAMLAHEVAHLARRDAWWQLADALAHAALLYHPLAGLARRRLAAIAELSCDAWAARATGDALALAECLAQCVARSHAGRDYAPLAPAMAGSRSPVLARVEHLLSENPMSALSRKRLVRAMALAGLIGAAFVLPAIGVAEPAQARERHASVEIEDSLFGHSMRARYRDEGVELAFDADGRFAFNERETDLATLADGAEVSIEETRGDTTRRIEFTAEDGAIARRYEIEGDDAPFDAAARQWLAQVIPQVLRATGVDAEARVARLQARGGVPAVLDETDRIDSDYVRRVYLVELASQADPDAPQLSLAIAQAAKIGSDFERREALTALATEPALGQAQQLEALSAVESMDSDFEQRSVFEALAPALADDAAVAAATRAALDAIESAFERREAIGYLAARQPLPPALLGAAITASADIDSDFERREALGSLAPHLRGQAQTVPAYIGAIAGIDSDFERREAIAGLVDATALDAAGYAAAIEAAAGIDSDFECRSALVSIARRMPADPALIEQYRKVARGLDDFERGQAEKALDRLATL